MQDRLDKVGHWLRLARLEFVLAAVADMWLVILLAVHIEPAGRQNPDLTALPLPIALLLGAIIAAGLSIYGLVLNDMLDVRRDRTLMPGRPLPTGKIGFRAALVIGVLGLLSALSSAVMLGEGAALLCGLTATLILFYNTTARFLPAAGIITFAVVRMLHMFVANPEMGMLWPVWLNLTFVLAIGTAVHILLGRRPRMSGGTIGVICGAWVFWTFALLGWMNWRHTETLPMGPANASLLWVGPAVMSLIIALLAWYFIPSTGNHHAIDTGPTPGHAKDDLSALRRIIRLKRLRQHRATGRRLIVISCVGLIALDASWLMSAGWWTSGLVILSLAGVAGVGEVALRIIDMRPGSSPPYRMRGLAK